MKIFDVAVVGLGAVGSAALYHLAKQKELSVIGIDRFDPPHCFGSSHGETRITRLAVGEGKDYVNLALRSQKIWKGLESISGVELFHPVGGILMDSGIQPWAKHGGAGFFEKTVSYAQEMNIPHQIYSSEKLRERYPQFLLEKEGKAYFEPSAGYLFPEEIIRVQLSLANEFGAKLKVNAPVSSIEMTEDVVKLHLKEEKVFARRVLLAAGGWVKEFLPQSERPKFKICRQVLHWVRLEEGNTAYKESPVFMWGFGPNPEDFIYGFPSLDGESIKLSSESFVETESAEQINRSVTKEEQEKFWKERVEGRIGGLKPEFVKSEVCFYTVTEDSRFVMGKLPEMEQVTYVSACSGHGFKHSAALGELLADQLKEPFG
ncbi:N-methyl-L-tryptophan oxidase [Algoriphagus sp. CAU 1675]|uniref:N-methyl-L-tryptophan oxidase n=1 Tax=Algoriphagus sp. CAU 1675 TaxID=3032597 RepID=UPI0023D9F7F2|nr:N-methyl-L-tryptophan oxidase [Algoriphagus sp. CAU 1675]MDF2156270.1 N-methyl-L-tryptophan oxidase [Algoriphagus sp. CAU 1675]